MESTENSENSDPQIVSLIPSDYKTKIVSYTKEREGFVAVIRVDISSKNEALKWLEDFSANSFCTFKVDRTYPENTQKLVFKKEYRCHHNTRPSSHRVSRHHPKHTGCNAKLTITIKQKDLKRSKDPYLKNYPTEIFLRHIHNHPIKSEYSLRHRPPTEKVKEIFENLYSKGHSPASALHAYKIQLQQEYAEDFNSKVVDGAFYPSKRTCYDLYYRFKKKHPECVDTSRSSKANTATVTSTGEPCILEDVAYYVETTGYKESENPTENDTEDITENENETENVPESDPENVAETDETETIQIDLPEIIDHIQQFCTILENFVREKPEIFATAVEQFIKNFDDLETEPDLVNALNCFGKVPVNTRKRKPEISVQQLSPTNVQLNNDHSYFSDERQDEEEEEEGSASKRRKSTQAITLIFENSISETKMEH